MHSLDAVDVAVPGQLSARCPARLHGRLDGALHASLSQGLVLGDSLWSVPPDSRPLLDSCVRELRQDGCPVWARSQRLGSDLFCPIPPERCFGLKPWPGTPAVLLNALEGLPGLAAVLALAWQGPGPAPWSALCAPLAGQPGAPRPCLTSAAC